MAVEQPDRGEESDVPPCRRSRPAGDGGFTLLEVLVSVGVVSVVMLALSSYFVVTTRIGNDQGDQQGAIQAAGDAMELARALQTGAQLSGRDLQSTTTQWNAALTGAAAIPGLGTVLADAVTGSACAPGGGETAPCVAYDKNAATGAGAAAVLPTTYREVTFNSVKYQQRWFITFCERSSTGACVPSTRAGTTGLTHFFRVIVAVTWSSRSCNPGPCSYVTATLITKDTGDPEFSTNATSTLQITTSAAARANDQNIAITSVPFAATGGKTPYAWSANSLPTGLIINAGTGTITGTPTVPGTYATVVIVTDDNGVKDFVPFSWVIAAPTAMTAPGAVSSQGGVAESRTFTVTGGTSPYTWAGTGLPAGLSLNSGTGVVSGTPNTVGASSVTLTVTDKFGQAGSQTFTWTVPALSYGGFTPPATASGVAIASVTLAAAGGIRPYTWSATTLPAGLALNTSTGVISGTPTAAGTFAVTTAVVDSKGTTVARSVLWTVS